MSTILFVLIASGCTPTRSTSGEEITSKRDARALDDDRSGTVPVDRPVDTIGWLVMLGEPTGLEPDGVTPSKIEVSTARGTVAYSIPADSFLEWVTADLVDELVDIGITASLITDGVIKFTLDGDEDQFLEVELTDDGIDCSTWIIADDDG